jgi:hypothetical protein
MINPVRERFGFGFTMERWADLAKQDRREYFAQTRNEKRGRGRPYDDTGRFAALLLAVIFEEYTGKRPGRMTRERETDTRLRDKDSSFYKFCRAACDAVGSDVSDKAFREAIDELSGRGDWESNVPALRLLLWGELQMADAEYERIRSRFFSALEAVAEGKHLSDILSSGPPVQISVGSALIDAATHLRERLDLDELSKAGRALDRLGVDRATICAMRKDEIAEIVAEALKAH